MATKKEDKKELRHREWAKQIAECQSSGMKIKDWCKMKDISCNTYYRRLHVVKMERNEKAEQPMQKIVPLSIAEEVCGAAVPAASQPLIINKTRESIVMRKDGIEILFQLTTLQFIIYNANAGKNVPALALYPHCQLFGLHLALGFTEIESAQQPDHQNVMEMLVVHWLTPVTSFSSTMSTDLLSMQFCFI